jgi:chromate transporter
MIEESSRDLGANGRAATGSVFEVLRVFLKLGLTSFGGPIAHIGYFRRELVEKRQWLGESEFARLLALCQFLPGPASSQLGFSLGLLRAGWLGAVAAFVAFTLPSAILLFVFAALIPYLSTTVGQAVIHGLKLVAVAVVAQAVLGMTRQLAPDAPRATIAAISAAIILASGHPWTQILVVVLGGLAGVAVCRTLQPPDAETQLRLPYGVRFGIVLLAVFTLLLFLLPVVARGHDGLLAVSDAFYRAGALVFGGGHVVLPLLQEAVVAPGWVSSDDFLAGYGAAQAVPGPLFSFAAYLGARLPGAEGGIVGATVALIAIFLPGFLLVAGALPVWHSIADTRAAGQIVAGINAAVVGLLAAALYDPVWTSAVRGPVDVAIAAIGFTLLVAWRSPPLVVVLWCAGATVVVALV